MLEDLIFKFCQGIGERTLFRGKDIVDYARQRYEIVIAEKNYPYYEIKVIPHKIAVFEAGMELEKYIDASLKEKWYNLLLMHDMSKFSVGEIAYATHNFNEWERNSAHQKRIFELAWHHHKMHNPHHPEFWFDVNRQGETKPMPMPAIYVYEMVADWIGDGKIYGTPLELWLPNHLPQFNLHPATSAILAKILNDLGIETKKNTVLYDNGNYKALHTIQ